MKKNWIALCLIVCLFIPTYSIADEGMWIPLLLKNNEKDMQSKGLKLSAEDIYSINQNSIKDAIVIFGGGCTGEVVSDQGLLFTNHHCGFGQIQYHSSLENDYLTNGFWASSMNEELPCPGLSVTFLVKMEEVTNQILGGLPEDISEKERADSIRNRSEKLIKENESNTHYKVRITPFYSGNAYYMFVNEVFNDVRLVGAPPSNIGKFGGDTDNWVWPRHTGDFSVFRIYADSNNMPAEYVKTNLPYKPKKYLPISIKGMNEGDFTFVFGYPGRTQQYISSYAVKHISEVENPLRIQARDLRLDVIKKAMNQDPLVRIKYAAKAASIANGWKKWIGENKGLKRLKTIEQKEAFEKDFTKWASTAYNGKFAGLLPAMDAAYQELYPYRIMSILFTEIGIAPEILKIAYSFNPLCKAARNKEIDKKVWSEEIWKEEIERYTKNVEKIYKDYDPAVDEEIFKALKGMEIDGISMKPDDYTAENLYNKSLFKDKSSVEDLLQKPFSARKSFASAIEKDIAYKYASLLYGQYFNQILPAEKRIQRSIDSLQRIYMQAQMLMPENQNKMFYPDANFTLRVAYGNISGFSPADAVYYKPFTTIEGIMEKENPEIYDYVVEEKLKELYENKDYGRYADSLGNLPVAFIATNHTTGGNSGSPVLNANGELIGLNFDRNWEGTMSDIDYDPLQCRNITLDIRYCLFLIDKFAGAERLIRELKIVE